MVMTRVLTHHLHSLVLAHTLSIHHHGHVLGSCMSRSFPSFELGGVHSIPNSSYPSTSIIFFFFHFLFHLYSLLPSMCVESSLSHMIDKQKNEGNDETTQDKRRAS